MPFPKLVWIPSRDPEVALGVILDSVTLAPITNDRVIKKLKIHFSRLCSFEGLTVVMENKDLSFKRVWMFVTNASNSPALRTVMHEIVHCLVFSILPCASIQFTLSDLWDEFSKLVRGLRGV